MINIKRYDNRKYYILGTGHYANLPKLAELVKQGNEINVTDTKNENCTRKCLENILASMVKDGSRDKIKLTELIRSL